MNTQPHRNTDLGVHADDVESTLAELERRDVVARIWSGDHTVWNPDPTEIANRLGWLTVTDAMRGVIPSLKRFADEAKNEGFRHVVLLGMGGSSLGPEVLRQTFGNADGYPRLIVLDSTAPASVQAVADTIDPATTLFLVSSKSGSTIEPNTFYSYFRQLVDQKLGGDQSGRNFVAITDAGTVLEELGRREGFRHVFANPSDIGGRYSILSYFGLVPAALTGIDLADLLDRADGMRARCAPDVAVRDNPGAWLGAAFATLASAGRDKLTVLTSPSIDSFGLWAEQLIAESLGKEQKGIVPVAGEPALDHESYGSDRAFVYLRVDGEANGANDRLTDLLKSAGHPVIRLDLRDSYDLGAEFFRWEFATVVAGAVIGVQPFDQPNVQAAKDMTDSVLEAIGNSETLPDAPAIAPVEELMTGVRPGDYVAIMAYVHQTPEMDEGLHDLRGAITDRFGVATTLGYGPRFLHSTGQLHKGGPPSGVFLQITTNHAADIVVPGKRITFGTLADAQALGDLRALQAAGRRVSRVHLAQDEIEAIREVAAEIRTLTDE